jgi:hypothetical protein
MNQQKDFPALSQFSIPGGGLCLEVVFAGDLIESYKWDTLYHEPLMVFGLLSLQMPHSMGLVEIASLRE